MTAEGALAAYEAARPRLPRAAPGGPARKAAHLGEIAEGFDAFLLDAFGVLNIGETAIPGVADRITTLRGGGRPVMVLTNAASVPADALVEKYARLGYDFDPAEVVSSRMVLLDAVRAAPARHWGVMAQPDLQGEDLSGLDLTYLGDAPAGYDEAEAFLFLGSGSWTEARQDRLETALRRRPRPVWVGNPDLVAPRADGFSVEPGFYAHRLAAIPGVELQFFGKPFPGIFEQALERIPSSIPRGRVLMVGDSLHTDVLGAQSAGVRSALVTGYGFSAGIALTDAIAATGIAPDYMVERP